MKCQIVEEPLDRLSEYAEIPIRFEVRTVLDIVGDDPQSAVLSECPVESPWVKDYDAIVLDIMLPKIDGIEVCRKLRELNVEAPVIMLTARNAVEDRIRGLNAGADDYLTKPFAFSELIARIRALLRRERTPKSTKLQVGDLVLDPGAHSVYREDKEIQDFTDRSNFSIQDELVNCYQMERPFH